MENAGPERRRKHGCKAMRCAKNLTTKDMKAREGPFCLGGTLIPLHYFVSFVVKSPT
jgi:hypothetical protein